MIHVCLVGFGRMGQAFFEQAQASPDVRVVSVIDRSLDPVNVERLFGIRTFSAHEPAAFQNVDVVLDVSSVQGLEASVALCESIGIPVVCGVTGLESNLLATLKRRLVSIGGRAVFAANFSFGVAAFLQAAKSLATALPAYDVEIVEMHHRHKKDAPSGTATVLADVVAGASGKSERIFGRHGAAQRGDGIGMHSVRAGDFFGEHLLILAGPGEHVELRHSAHSRLAFAKGALEAVRFVHSVRTPGVYSMDDVVSAASRR